MGKTLPNVRHKGKLRTYFADKSTPNSLVAKRRRGEIRTSSFRYIGRCVNYEEIGGKYRFKTTL